MKLIPLKTTRETDATQSDDVMFVRILLGCILGVDVYLVILNTDMIAAHSYPILILQHPMLGPSLQDSNDTSLSDSKNEF